MTLKYLIIKRALLILDKLYRYRETPYLCKIMLYQGMMKNSETDLPV